MSDSFKDRLRHGDQKAAERRHGCEVHSEHLSSLEPIHELLAAMNDPYEAAGRIAPLIDRIPVLVARCERALLRRMPYAQWNSTAHLLTLIGNRGLEAELLSLLEDLTQLKLEEEEKGSGRVGM